MLIYQYASSTEDGALDYAVWYDIDAQETTKRIGLPATGGSPLHRVSQDRKWIVASETDGQTWTDTGSVAVYDLDSIEEGDPLATPKLIDVERATGEVGSSGVQVRGPYFDPLSEHDLLLFLDMQESGKEGCQVDVWRLNPETGEAAKDEQLSTACNAKILPGPEGDLIDFYTADEATQLRMSNPYGFTVEPEMLEAEGVPMQEMGEVSWSTRRESDGATWVLKSEDDAHRLYQLESDKFVRLEDPNLTFDDDLQPVLYPVVRAG
ncbi:MAG: hypothetical protein L0H47_11730 [Micrococcaceae bacterium]|nr:hypothetical protein [Micrococcaceae bacterium]